MKKTNMKRKLVAVILAIGVLVSGMYGPLTNKAEASSTSQASYKLTAYNSKGKKINVSAPKNTVVTKVSGKNWYKGSIKYTSYKRVSGKWKKQSKTSTIYVPSSKVKKYTTTTSTIKPVTTTKWVKKIKTVKGWFDNEDNWTNEIKTGDIAKAGSIIMIQDPDDIYLYGSLDVEDQYGEQDSAITLEDAVLTQEPTDSTTGYANVKYIDYDPQKVITNKPVKITKTSYKTPAPTQAYTKIYVAPAKGITLSRYNKIKLGMTYNQVVEITYDKGTLLSSSSSYSYSYKLYEFRQNKDEYKYAWIHFKNGKVISKSQSGLH